MNGGYFKFEVNNKNEFDKCIFMSKTMLIYAQHFLDIVIVDSTYKRNRFNLPLINVIGINNFGKFGLLSEETSRAYTRLFSQLKQGWENKKPMNFITDDCQAMKQG